MLIWEGPGWLSVVCESTTTVTSLPPGTYTTARPVTATGTATIFTSVVVLVTTTPPTATATSREVGGEMPTTFDMLSLYITWYVPVTEATKRPVGMYVMPWSPTKGDKNETACAAGTGTVDVEYRAEKTDAPVAPVAPSGPAGPVGPTAAGPAAPVAPVAPVVPADPVGPVAPAAPVAPVAPDAPVAPVGPTIPGGQQGRWVCTGQYLLMGNRCGPCVFLDSTRRIPWRWKHGPCSLKS